MNAAKTKLAFVTLASSFVLMACGNTNQDEGSTSSSEASSQETMSSEQTSSSSAMESSSEMSSDMSSEASSDSSATSDTNTKGIENKTFDTSVDDVIKKFNDTFPNAKITSLSIDNDNNSYVYEVEGYNDTNELELKVDANTGEIVKQDDDDDRDDVIDDDVLDLDGIVSPQEAMKAALDEVGSGYAKEWELDSKNGKVYYEIDVEGSKQAQDDVHIDAKTGDFIGYD